MSRRISITKESYGVQIREQPTDLKWEKQTLEKAKCFQPNLIMGFPGISDGKESACNEGDPGLSPGLGRFPWRKE